MSPDPTIPTPDLPSTGAPAVSDAEEALHPQESRVVRDVQGNPLPGTDDPGQDTVARSDGRGGT